MSPYLFGGNQVVRYLVTPTRPDRGDRDGSDNFLRDALVADLDPRTNNPGTTAVFDFWIRVRDSATQQDVEDACRWWNGPRDRNLLLGRIEIPMQDFETPDRLYACEHLAFNPWNCLPEHRPVGSLNRMRLAV